MQHRISREQALSTLRDLNVRQPGYDKLSPRNQDILVDGCKRVDKADALLARAERRQQGVPCFTCTDRDFVTAKVTQLVTADPNVTADMFHRASRMFDRIVGDNRVTIALAKLAENAERFARKAHAA